MKWPLEPLMALARTRDGERMTMKELSLALGMAPSSVQHWKERGIPSDEKAEKAAVLLGFDPYVVWDGWAEAQFAALARPCLECGTLFVPVRKGNLYCNRRCTQKRAQRRYKKTAKGAEANRRHAREYAQRYPTYIAKKRARYYWENRDAQLAQQKEYKARLRGEAA